MWLHLERTLEACAWFPLDFTTVLFPFADFSLYAFIVINFSHEHDDMLSPVSPPKESQTCGLSCRPQTEHRLCIGWHVG